MTMSDNMKESIYYHYSPTYKYSVGIESVKDKFFDKDYLYLRLTYLLNRKNTKNSQRNLYFQSAISPDDLNDNFYGIHGDWETRRLFSGPHLSHPISVMVGAFDCMPSGSGDSARVKRS